MHLKLEGRLTKESDLPDLGHDDAGRTWWIDEVWFIWTGSSWQRAIATQDLP